MTLLHLPQQETNMKVDRGVLIVENLNKITVKNECIRFYNDEKSYVGVYYKDSFIARAAYDGLIDDLTAAYNTVYLRNNQEAEKLLEN